MVLAAGVGQETLTLDIDGQPIKSAVFRSYKAEALTGKPIRITNTGDAPLQAVVSVSGSPITPEPAASNGFKIERNYFTLDGKPADQQGVERSLRSGVEDHRDQAECGHIMVSVISRPGLGSTAHHKCHRAIAARSTGSRMARSLKIPSSATTASRNRRSQKR